MRPHLLVSALAAAVVPALAQQHESIGPDIIFDQDHNTTSIVGSWSSGSGAVTNGPGFVNPIESTFVYPAVSGIAYSFTADGFFEESLYRFKGNGTDPRCIQGVIQWQHGEYELLANGSIVLNPFPTDGRQQVQNPCAAESNVLKQFNQTTLFSSWRIFTDAQGQDKLHLFAFDGSPFAPQFRRSLTPTMLPTRQMTNTTLGSVAGKRSLHKRSSASLSSAPLTLAGMTAAGIASMALLSVL